MTVRVAVVDDQTLFAETLRTALNTDPGVDVVAVLSSGAEFLKTVSSSTSTCRGCPGSRRFGRSRTSLKRPPCRSSCSRCSPHPESYAPLSTLAWPVSSARMCTPVSSFGQSGRRPMAAASSTPNWPQQPLSSVRIPSRRLNDGYCAAPRAVLTRNQSPPNCS